MAYGGLMVYGTSPAGAFPGRDLWIDVDAADARGNWVPAETERLRQLLERLAGEGIAVDQIRVLSPFRHVVAEARKVHRSVFRTRDPEAAAAAERWVGTVHTMQGKEADLVILVLGGDPARSRTRRWAAERPNLLNVAVSRASRRLYVIGNRRLWEREHYSRVLVDRLERWPPARPAHPLP
jgi:superfamily I DNA and/or RNA helicase